MQFRLAEVTTIPEKRSKNMLEYKTILFIVQHNMKRFPPHFFLTQTAEDFSDLGETTRGPVCAAGLVPRVNTHEVELCAKQLQQL